jgi:hypothetical protein
MSKTSAALAALDPHNKSDNVFTTLDLCVYRLATPIADSAGGSETCPCLSV